MAIKNSAGIYLFAALFISLLSFSQVNVYDTLHRIGLFEDHLHHDRKENYLLDKKGKLRREVHLKNEALHFHRWFEDSLDAALKKLYPKLYTGLVFYAADNVSWELSGGSFGWKAGKKIDEERLNAVFPSEAEMKQEIKRAAWLKQEDEGHLFFHNFFLRDSASKTVYCFNGLEGKPDGQISYNAQRAVIYELAYYPDRKIFYEFRNGKLEVFSPEGAKLYERTEEKITGYGDNETTLWIYDTATGTVKFENGFLPDNFDISNAYYSRLAALWRANFSK